MAFSASSFTFGQTSSLSFGAASNPSTSMPLFGSNPASGSAPAFGASSSSLFGAASTPAFGAVSTPAVSSTSTGLFGTTPVAATSAPAFGSGLFGAPASSASLFSAASAPAFGPSLFSQSTPQTSAPATTTALWQPQGGAAAAQSQAQSSSLLTYNTKWEEIPQQMQQQLSQLQQVISGARDDCDKLDRDQRLHDHVELKKSLQEETGALKQSLKGLLGAVQVDDDHAIRFREQVMKLMHSTESAVRTYQRSKLWRDAPRGQVLPPGVQEQLSAPVVLPSPHLELAIKQFNEVLNDYRQLVSQLSQALPTAASPLQFGTDGPLLDGSSLAQSLPAIISNMYQYMLHVAAALESVHNKVRDSKEAFLSQRRAQGDYTNPFQQRGSAAADVFAAKNFQPAGSSSAAAAAGGASGRSGAALSGASHSFGMPPASTVPAAGGTVPSLSPPSQPQAAGLMPGVAAPAAFGGSNPSNAFQTPQAGNISRSKSSASRSKSRR